VNVSEGHEQLSLLKRRAYTVALPVTLLAVLLTLALDLRGGRDPFNQIALPLLAGLLLTLTLGMSLRWVPLRWIEHSFYLIAAGSFFTKFGFLVVRYSGAIPDAEIAQVYIWAPFIYLLSFLIFQVREALKWSLLVYGLSFVLGVYAVVSSGAENLGNFIRLAEFYLASGLWVAMLYILGTLKTQLSQLQVQFSEMERLAHRDTLTGLGNRRQMEVRLLQQVEQFQRYGMSWAVILFDIDNFKGVNDAHGHDGGDAVLQEVARFLQRELRDTDQFARWGGEEFIILAPQIDLFYARALAERLRSLLAHHPFEAVGSVTASFGVAAYRDGEGIPSLMQRVDETLYRAKHGGKNRVEVSLMTTQPLTLPQLHNPFLTQAPDPDPALCREASDWLEAFGLGPHDPHSRHAFAAGFAGLAAALHPQAPRAALRLTTDWYSLMFLHDDRCDSSGIGKDPARLQRLAERLLSVFQGSPLRLEDEPLAYALADLRQRLLEQGGARWLRALTECVRDYLDALIWEAANRANGTVPDLDEYLYRRPVTAGLKIDAAFIEVVDGVQLPHAVRHHPAVQHLVELADRAVCWSNDILSLNKELQEGDVHNLVLVLMQAHHLSVQDALDEAARMYHEEVEGFLAGERALPSFGAEEDAQLRQYVQLLKTRVGGILAWSQRSKRYRVTELVA
jgi:diguanylate cyclase (GGDEF)-like protein